MVTQGDRSSNRVPAHFLVKLTTEKRYHYIFCEMSTSYNFSLDGDAKEDPDGPGPLLTRECLEDLLKRCLNENRGIKLEACILPEPGDAEASYTTRMQSIGQSIND